MAQRSHVPKFGNWESGENVPYTVYFDKARKGKTGEKMINPNDPQENMSVFSEDKPYTQAPNNVRAGIEPEVKVGQGVARPKHEDGDFRRTDSPARHDAVGRRATNEPSHQRYGDRETSKRAGRQGGERSIEQSPLHPVYQAKTGGKGSGTSSENIPGLAPSTPGRTRLRPTRNEETPERAAAVPKFGEWDENNPASADGFTHIFNKVREEKHNGGMANVTTMPTDSYSNRHNQQGSDDTKGCGCFSWMSRK